MPFNRFDSCHSDFKIKPRIRDLSEKRLDFFGFCTYLSNYTYNPRIHIRRCADVIRTIANQMQHDHATRFF